MKRLAAAALLAAGCTRAPEPDAVGAGDNAGAPAASTADAGGRAARAPEDPVAGALERAPILALRPVGAGREARFEAQVALEGGPRRVGLALAEQGRPLAYRRPLAFYRLARALGARVVPAAAVRRIGLGEVAALLEGQPGAIEQLRQLAALNDGRIDALLTAPTLGPPGPAWDAARGPRGAATPARRVVSFEGPELEVWARWAASPSPAPGERTSLVRDYVEALAVDYLAGHVLRRALVVDDAAGALILEENAGAFPMHVPERALDRFLRRLAAAARFPRSLRDGLARLGRAEAAAALAPGAVPGAAAEAPAAPEGFEEWLIPPRALIELDERRAALVTLIEAKIAARGEAAVLCL